MATTFSSDSGEIGNDSPNSNGGLAHIAVETLPFLIRGLDAESAAHATISILKHTDLEAVAITSERSLLAFSGHDREGKLEAIGNEMVEALRKGDLTYLDRPGDLLSAEATLQRGIIAPLRLNGQVVGSLVIAYSGSNALRREKAIQAGELARLLSSQLQLGAQSLADEAEVSEVGGDPMLPVLADALVLLCRKDPSIAETFVERVPWIAEQFREARVRNDETVKNHSEGSATNEERLYRQRIGRLPVEKSGRTVLLDVESIVFAQVRGGHFFVNTHDESFHVRFSLRELETRLGSPSFFRCHRSFLVNLRQVDEVLPMFNGTYILYVKDLKKSAIPVSRQQAKQLRDLLGL